MGLTSSRDNNFREQEDLRMKALINYDRRIKSYNGSTKVATIYSTAEQTTLLNDPQPVERMADRHRNSIGDAGQQKKRQA